MSMPGMTNAQKAQNYLQQFEYWADQVGGHEKLSRRAAEAECQARGDGPNMVAYYTEADMAKNPWAVIAKGNRDAALARANLYTSLAIMDQLNAQQPTRLL